MNSRKDGKLNCYERAKASFGSFLIILKTPAANSIAVEIIPAGVLSSNSNAFFYLNRLS